MDNNRKDLEVIEFEGEKYLRIDPENINISEMTLVQKVTDVIAFRVTSGKVKIVTRHYDVVETENYAEPSDFIVYNIGAVPEGSLSERMRICDKKVIKSEDFHKLYSEHGEQVELSEEDINSILGELQEDNEDNSDFTDFNFVSEAYRYEYIGKPVSVARVPFNFVIHAPWGSDQYIKAGGYVIFNPNTTKEEIRDIYGAEGAHNREGGQLEKTYKIAEDTRKGVINDTFKMVIKADKSPIAGIQFNMPDLARAYDRVGKELTANLERYIDIEQR